MQNFDGLKELLREGQEVVITTHLSPDADALGSSVGLYLYLKKLGCRPVIIVPNDYPRFLEWMVHDVDVINFEKNEKSAADAVRRAGIIFCLDFNALNRIGDLEKTVSEAPAFKVMIDHHLEPSGFSDASLWSTQAAATAELIVEFIEKWMQDAARIDPDMANALYAGIMTDTGSFKHPNTTQNVHEVVSRLIKYGANVSRVAKLIYDTNTERRLRFLGYMLNEKLTILKELHTAYIVVTKEDLERFNSENGDTEGLVNYALSIEDIVLAFTVIEKDGKVKLSFRSTGDFSVNELARKHFSGGGHKNAAGGISEMPPEKTRDEIIRILSDYKQQLINALQD